ncbi:hypothetical protein GCM10007920_25770 [Ciceribacter naphthalenivorans]|nr:hypothetical protein GCM10007920_25770 [Ciceribacter naphthalenivorans]GLT05645.1 hypothetical protein GCM10007926_25770 [Sphingomonas psychrolutea]
MKRALWAALALLGGTLAMVSSARAEDESRPTPEQIEEARVFVVNNAIFTLFHEAGHMLISEFGLPVLGREEDAVDALSSILLLEADDEALDVAIQDAADGWFLSDESKERDLTDTDLLDTHALDRQRAYQIVCMMTGADPEFFKEFADSIEFPESRREECAAEYERAKASWFGLLEPHYISQGPASSMTVIYEPTGDETMDFFANLLKEAGVLENVAQSVGAKYRFNDGIKLTAKSCGVANAFWDPQAREITYCYELAVDHIVLIDDYFKRDQTAKN